jgi:hypothetical protein
MHSQATMIYLSFFIFLIESSWIQLDKSKLKMTVNTPN